MVADADSDCLLADIEMQEPRCFSFAAGYLSSGLEPPEEHQFFIEPDHMAGLERRRPRFLRQPRSIQP
jgi:hypothetical protein